MSWRSKQAVSAACGELIEEHNEGVVQAMRDAKKRGALVMMEHILTKMRTRSMTAGVLLWRLNKAAMVVEKQVESAEMRGLEIEMAAAMAADEARARRRESGMRQLERTMARWWTDSLWGMWLVWRDIAKDSKYLQAKSQVSDAVSQLEEVREVDAKYVAAAQQAQTELALCKLQVVQVRAEAERAKEQYMWDLQAAKEDTQPHVIEALLAEALAAAKEEEIRAVEEITTYYRGELEEARRAMEDVEVVHEDDVARPVQIAASLMTGEENIGSVAHLSPLEQVVLISQMESERQVLLAHLHVSPNATVEELHEQLIKANSALAVSNSDLAAAQRQTEDANWALELGRTELNLEKARHVQLNEQLAMAGRESRHLLTMTLATSFLRWKHNVLYRKFLELDSSLREDALRVRQRAVLRIVQWIADDWQVDCLTWSMMRWKVQVDYIRVHHLTDRLIGAKNEAEVLLTRHIMQHLTGQHDEVGQAFDDWRLILEALKNSEVQQQLLICKVKLSLGIIENRWRRKKNMRLS